VRTRVGEGTVVTAMLPLSHRTPVDLPDFKAKSPSFRGHGKVLFVDDQEEVRVVGEKMLRRLGYTVLTASSGNEALQIVEQERGKLKLVMLDMIMPGINGEQAMKLMKQNDASLRVILCTGYNERALQEGFADRGFDAFLPKPFQFEDLVRCIQEIA
jgi:two-component system, cell cycle sensor histidine kinase and response regulator CckA